MASKSTYECFVCKNNGFPAVLVYLAGKDDQGRAIRLEQDGTTPHVHKTKVPSQQQSQEQGQGQQSTDLALEVKLLHQKIVQLNEKVDKILAMLERQQGAVSA